MRHSSVQVRAMLTRDELDRYNALFEVGKYLEKQKRHDLAYVVQKEIELLVQPAIGRLQEKSRQRDRETEEYLRKKAEANADDTADEEN